MDEQLTPEHESKDDVIANLQEQLKVLQSQVTSMERFANIVVAQRNEAHTEVAKLLTNQGGY